MLCYGCVEVCVCEVEICQRGSVVELGLEW